jgi:hypothetical protein
MAITRPTLQAQSAGTPADSALANTNAGTESHAKLIAAVGGKKRRKTLHRGGAVEVAKIDTPYTPTGGPTQTPEYIMKQNTASQSQGAANASLDKFLGGGYMKWGCSSGGRRRSCRFNHNHSTHHHGKSTRKDKHSSHHRGRRCATKKRKTHRRRK